MRTMARPYAFGTIMKTPAFSSSSFVGAFFQAYHARTAAKAHPVEALRCR